jgi:hypothetical protein
LNKLVFVATARSARYGDALNSTNQTGRWLCWDVRWWALLFGTL